MGAIGYIAHVIRPALDWSPTATLFVALDVRSRLFLVDMSGIRDAADFDADGVNPNSAGYMKMARLWFAAITAMKGGGA